MEKEFVNYEQSLALKDLGFDEKTLMFVSHSSGHDIYTKEKYKSTLWLCNGYDAKSQDDKFQYEFPEHGESWTEVHIPLYQQVFRWFKEKYQLMLCITPCSDGEYIFTLYDLNKCDLEVFVEDIEIMESEDSYEFFEEAELECLKKLIDIVKLSHKTATI